MTGLDESVLAADELMAPLRESLASLAIKAPASRIFIAIAQGAKRHYLSVGNNGSAAPADLRLPLGCCAKLLVSALIRSAATEGLLDLDASPHRVVGERVRPSFARLADVSLLQLLNHTHGLQRSTLRSAPHRNDGRLDVEELARSLDLENRLAPPGAIYSYGHDAAWICAAVLEDIWGASFREILGAKIFPAGEIASTGEVACPSTGGGFTITADALLSFLMRHSVISLSRLSAPLPGWSPFVSACTLGWHTYEAGWMGHDSVSTALPMIVRADPGANLAIVVAANGLLPSAVASRGFSKSLPDLVKLRVPRMKPVRHPDDPPLDGYCGAYGNGDTRIDIAPLGQGLGWRLSQGTAPAVADPGPQPLVPAENEVFLCTGRNNKIIPFVQFRSLDAGRKFLWTGELTLTQLSRADAQ